MAYWTFRVDTIGIDELRDMLGDCRGFPSTIHQVLYATREQAVAAMLEEVNDAIESYNNDADDDEKLDHVTEADIDTHGCITLDDQEEYSLIEFEVKS